MLKFRFALRIFRCLLTMEIDKDQLKRFYKVSLPELKISIGEIKDAKHNWIS